MCRGWSSVSCGASDAAAGAVPRCLLHLRGPGPRATGPPVEPDWTRWTPAWERGDGGVFLDLTGSGRLLGEGADGPQRVCREVAEQWPVAAAGVGPTRLTAALASGLAAAWPGATGAGASLLVLAPGGGAAFLAGFPLEVLARRHVAAVTALRRFGVRTLGELGAVPEQLLKATFGEEGAQLAREARAGDERPLAGAPLAEGVVARARFRSPLAGRAGQSALRRALAVRALLACPEGPGGWLCWRLHARWGEGAEPAAVEAPGCGPPTLRAWLRLLEALWRRLPERRRGLLALELSAGPRRPAPPRQGDLFGDPEAGERRLAAGWAHWRARSPRGLYLACEELLLRWGVSWDGPPRAGRSGAAQNRAGGLPGGDAEGAAAGAAGWAASSRG